jgi:MFS family permease
LKRRTAVLIALCVLGAILYLDRVCISLALPQIQADLHISDSKIGWISLAFSLGYAVFEIPTGHMGDRFGWRKTMMRICIAWSIFTALTGLAWGFWSLMFIRFAFGAGEAGAWPNTGGIVSRWFPLSQRTRAMGIFGAATAAGAGLAPQIVIPIQGDYGWRTSFIIFGAVGLVWAAFWYFWFRETPAEMGAAPDEIAELPPPTPRATHGAPWRHVLRTKNMWFVMVAAFLNIYAAFFAVFWMPKFLGAARAFTPQELKWTSLVWIASCAGNLGGGFVVDFVIARMGRAVGRRVLGVTCGVIWGALCVGMVLTHDKVATMALMTGTGLMWGFIQSNLFAGTIDIAGRHTGSICGAMNTAGQFGGGVSAVAFGILVQRTGSYDIPMLTLAVAATIAGLLWFGIDVEKPVVPADEA